MRATIRELVASGAFGTSGVRGRADALTDRVCYGYAAAFLAHVAPREGAGGRARPRPPPEQPAHLGGLRVGPAALGWRLVYVGALPTPAIACRAAQEGLQIPARRAGGRALAPLPPRDAVLPTSPSSRSRRRGGGRRRSQHLAPPAWVAYVVSRDYNAAVKTVGVRDLKIHLSAHLRDVARGDVILVTDRGRVVAEVRPPGGVEKSLSPEDLARHRLVARGLLVPASTPGALAWSAPLPRLLRSGTAQELLDAGREDRFPVST